ncbi:MAG: hypothetical protein E7474_08860 [Ruminococcaceae bacterium]|nr:hypothetical protein [Oscillospiraceae bacterium]
MANIIVHCFYTGAEEDICGFFDEMYDSGIHGEVLEEDGCMQYDYFYSASDRSVGALLEKWRDDAALSKHMNGTAMAKLQEVKARYHLETRVERFVVQD